MIFILIGIVFTIIFYMVYTKFLEFRDERYNWVRPPLPLWAFLLLIIVELIPVFNVIVIGIIHLYMQIIIRIKILIEALLV